MRGLFNFVEILSDFLDLYWGQSDSSHILMLVFIRFLINEFDSSHILMLVFLVFIRFLINEFFIIKSELDYIWVTGFIGSTAGADRE